MLSVSEEQINNLCNSIDRDYAIYQSKFNDILAAETNIQVIKKEQQNLTVLLAYFNKIVDSRKKEVIDKIKSLVSFGLQSILEDPGISLDIKFRMQRGQKYYSFVLIKDGEEDDLTDGVGGGVLDLCCFLLHVVFLSVTSNTKFLVLDEPFSALSQEYRENIGEFLQQLNEKLGIQFLIISHNAETEYFADAIYEIARAGKSSKLKRVK